MDGKFDEMVILAGSSNEPLAQEIADELGKRLIEREIKHFADGETYVQILETVRGKDVFYVQGGNKPVNDNFMEMLITLDALRRASAGRINVVMPYYGYARQDRKDKPRVPITAKLVANMITVAGADRVITADLHSEQIQGFFDIPLDLLQAMPLIADYIGEHNMDKENLVVVSPDVGSVKRSRALAEKLGVPLAIVDKRRPKQNVAEVMNVIGDIQGKDVIMLDDIVDTGGTLMGGAAALKKMGAKSIIAACTHGLLNGNATERLRDSEIDKFIMTNTVPLPEEKKIDKLEVVSIAPLFAKVIQSIHDEKPLSDLFVDSPFK